MTQQSLLFRCTDKINRLLETNKLRLVCPRAGLVQHFFPRGSKIQTGIVLSNSTGESGHVIQCWGVAFVDADHPLRCTNRHMSFYQESAALAKLLEELDGIV